MSAQRPTASSPSSTELAEEIERLQGTLAEREREADERERQLERYAADIRETFKELRRSYMATVRAMSNAVEFRDAYTAKHAERVAAYGLAIAQAMGLPLTDELESGFLLHDIGKMAVPDAILHKPGPLTEAEQAQMRQHPETGAEMLRGIDFLQHAIEIVQNHHERWDGEGYPQGLAGEKIPLAARVFAVADVFDALTTKRPYRAPCSIADARRMINHESGKQFDPRVVRAFNSIDDETFLRLAAQIG